jgi:hypothetical protein
MEEVIIDRYIEVAKLFTYGRFGDIPAFMFEHFKDRPVDKQHLIFNICREGVRVLGSGAYSVVFRWKGEAIKVTHDPNDKWSVYARYAMENWQSNPMLPKIYELHESHGWCIARMELLEDACIEHSVGMFDVVQAVRSPVFGLMNLTRKRKHERIGFYLKKWFDLRWVGGYSHTHLADIVIWMAGKGSKVNIDCHGKNWMQRNMQLVLTDPIY